MILRKLLHVMFHPQKNRNAKFGTDYELGVRGNSQWAWIMNVNSLNKGNISSYHISFTSLL